MLQVVTYRRVSTEDQGKEGLGMDAQATALAAYVAASGAVVLGEYAEVASGADNNRAELGKAMAHAKRAKAVLLVSKLCRLSRSAAFVLGLKERGFPFRAVECADAGYLETGLRSVFNTEERLKIGERTRDALAALKAKGVKLGGKRESDRADAARENISRSAHARAEALRGIIADARAVGQTSLRDLAKALTAAGAQTARNTPWTPTAVRNVLALLGE